VIRKNRNENGIRTVLFRSKPHSSSDLFSRSSCFFDIVVGSIMITIVSAIVFRIVIILITYLAFCKISNWKVDILII
jgi:hypothetical protein